jgi:hypothetical protein
VDTLPDSTLQRTPKLSAEHRHHHEVLSAISREVLEESSVHTITDGRQLPKGFSGRQRRRAPGVLYRVPRPAGTATWVFRPDAPDPDNPGLKYEATCKKLGGPGNVLYVHPSQHHLIDDTSVPVVFVEGIKKALAILSAARAAGAEVLVVGILGVWNWLSEGKPKPDMLGIPLDGRRAGICYDSDVFSNPDVADAARRLAGHVLQRGAATVELAYLPAGPGGAKTGADDYFARGHHYGEFVGTFRQFDPADLAAERLKRGDLLRAMLEDLGRTFWDAEFKGMGGHSSRDAFKVLVDLAPVRGKLHRDGLRVKVSWGELARMAKVSTRTLQKAIERLEEMRLIYRDNEGRRPRERGAFVLRAAVKHYGRGHAGAGATGGREAAVPVSTLHLRAPRLRWSSPAVKGRRGVVKDTRRVRLSLATNSRPAIKRLGKVRGALLDALDAAGGSLTLEEVCEVLHRSRPRDLVRFTASEKGHDGPAVMLLEAGVVRWVSDLQTRREVLRLAPDWLQMLEGSRQLAGEADAEVLSGRLGENGRPTVERRKGAETLQRERQRRKSEAFRRQDEHQPDEHLANAGADGTVTELRPAGPSTGGDDSTTVERKELSDSAKTVLGYVRRLGRMRLGLLEQIWLEDHGGDLAAMRRALDEAGVLRERLREFGDAEFLFPPTDKGVAA